ncbi:MAG: hypothetical protein ACREL7_17770, partial [Longimicrobiales bacterium]
MIELILNRMTPRMVRVTSLVAVLCGMFLLTAFLAWTTHRTHRDAVAQAEAQMHDFAAEAAAEWRQGLEQGIGSVVFASMRPFMSADELRGTAPLDSISTRLFYSADCHCIDPSAVRGAFRVVVGSGTVKT